MDRTNKVSTANDEEDNLPPPSVGEGGGVKSGRYIGVAGVTTHIEEDQLAASRWEFDDDRDMLSSSSSEYPVLSKSGLKIFRRPCAWWLSALLSSQRWLLASAFIIITSNPVAE